MDSSKILLIICAFVLIVCLTLCITTLSVLRHAVAENGTVQQTAATLIEELESCVEKLNGSLEKDDSVEVSVGKDQDGGASDGFRLCEVNGKIGVYTSDGHLIKLLDIAVSTLPSAAREALAQGITFQSWQELASLIQDYTP